MADPEIVRGLEDAKHGVRYCWCKTCEDSIAALDAAIARLSATGETVCPTHICPICYHEKDVCSYCANQSQKPQHTPRTEEP